MARILLTQAFPFLLPLRLKQKKAFFYHKIKSDHNQYASSIMDNLDHVVYKTKSKLINPDSGYHIKYQYNKVHNLKLAAEKINQIVIHPNEVFSFWWLVRTAQDKEEFKPGLNLIRGEISESPGGGLCQLSSMLHEMFLHTELTIVERKGHDSLSLYNPQITTRALDASINEGWIDLKVKNNTNGLYQIILDFDDEYMYGKILLNKAPDYKITIHNDFSKFYYKNDQVYLKTSVDKKLYDMKNDMEIDSHLYIDDIRIDYDISLIKEPIEREC